MNVQFEAKFTKDLKQISDGRLLKAVKELILACKEAESLTAISQVKKLKGYDTFYRVSTGNFLISELPLSDGRCEPAIDEITRMQPAELLLAAASSSL